MPLPDAAADDLARRFGVLVATLARAQFARLMRAIQAGDDAAKALADSLAGFTGGFADSLAEAFSELLRRSVFVKQVLALPVAGLTLSQHLYQHRRRTQAEALEVIRRHARGVIQARELALALYDGYDPKDGIKRPLEGSARASLPKFLRELTEDAIVRRDLDQVLARGQAQAARVKSAPLRAAYMETLAAWERGAAPEALKRRLDVAVREKNRYFANRIAQTELARAHQAQAAAEFMADPEVEILQVVMNPQHPKTDICDLHAQANLFGLGPGLYPKAKAPRPPFHPHCWCKLRSRPSLNGARWREAPRGEAAFLRGLPAGEAAKVMGSLERAARVLDGAGVADVVNAGKDPMYRLELVGQGADHPLLSAAGARQAYEEAKASGGRHHGFLVQVRAMGPNQRRKSLDSKRELVDLHLDKLANPKNYVPDWDSLRESHRASLMRRWSQEVSDQREQIAILEGYEDEHR